jgi:DNA polymerase-3 subunit delta
VFYLYGDESFQKEQAVQAIVSAHLDPATADFNLDRLRGSELDVEQLASVLATPPMMAEWRVVVLREVEALAGTPRARTVLTELASNPPPGLVAVLVATVPKGSKAKFYGELRKLATSAEFAGLSEADAPGWIMSYARDRWSVEVEPEAATAIVSAMGADLGLLSQEVDKLAAVAGDGEPVTVAVVEAAGTHLPRVDRWKWFERVGRKEFGLALEEMEILLAQGDSGVGLVIGLSSQLLRLGVAVEGGPAALEKALPPHQRWLARRMGDQADRWSGAELERALLDLQDVDRKLKSTPLSDEHLLGSWLLGRMADAQGVAA